MKSFDEKFQNKLLIFAWIIVLFLLMAVLCFRVLSIDPLHMLPSCIFKERTGYPCPGCGGTRAIMAFLDGNIIQSVQYHPVVPYVIFIYTIFLLTGTLHLRIKSMPYLKLKPIHFYILDVLILLQWIVKM